jgi:hypothetical protein
LSPQGTTLPVEGTSVILPDSGGVLTAFGRIGYELEEALADLVDNSIDANAGSVLIRFFRTSDRLVTLAVIDDGDGIAEPDLHDAMGFGVDTGKGFEALGKYGIGLKSASFSQCRSVTLVTRRDGSVAGRRWTADNVRRGWVCEHIESVAADRNLALDWGPISLSGSGTLVYWDDLDAFRVARDRADGVLEDYFHRIALHLGLHFHRFIASGRVRIYLDAINEETGERGSAREIHALDPFGYPQTGRQGYPRAFELNVSGLGPLELAAHIWPRRSRSPGYLLGGGKVSQRQGFYFYRNDRLIQAGGWNGWRDDAEPHSSLARVCVDLPGEYDHAFGLNVQKSAFSVPAGFLEALGNASSGDITFAQYIREAIDSYRSKAGQQRPEAAALLPRRGLPATLAARFRRVMAADGMDARPVALVWRQLPEDQFFELDREKMTVHINSIYRSSVLLGTRPGATDVPLVKTLLFLLLEDELMRQRTSGANREWTAKCQSLLVAAAQAQGR